MKINDNYEYRFIQGTAIEEREGDDGHITGYGAVFNKYSSDFGWFKEKVDPRAFDEVDMSDVFITFNHNFDNVLARTGNGTAELMVDDGGLKYRYKTPNTTVGKDVAELVRTQTVAGSSFMFTVKEDAWEDNGDGTYNRTILKVGRLLELGPVTVPAYPDTTAAARSFEASGLKPEGYDPAADLFLLEL